MGGAASAPGRSDRRRTGPHRSLSRFLVAKPRREEGSEFFRAARGHEPSTYLPPFDNEEGGDVLDAEPLE
jgi:hypothetical protein